MFQLDGYQSVANMGYILVLGKILATHLNGCPLLDAKRGDVQALFIAGQEAQVDSSWLQPDRA